MWPEPALPGAESTAIKDEPWDDWDAQVVPVVDLDAAQPAQTQARPTRMEYSSLPHQPTIRNFFRPTAAPAAPVVPKPAQSALCVNLDDSWDDEILMADAAATLTPCKYLFVDV